MVNYRVADLDAMLAQLLDAGVAVEGPMEHEKRPLWLGNGPRGEPLRALATCRRTVTARGMCPS
jgi:hypothetical protein